MYGYRTQFTVALILLACSAICEGNADSWRINFDYTVEHQVPLGNRVKESVYGPGPGAIGGANDRWNNHDGQEDPIPGNAIPLHDQDGNASGIYYYWQWGGSVSSYDRDLTGGSTSCLA